MKLVFKIAALSAFACACSSSSDQPDGPSGVISEDGTDLPLRGATRDQIVAFQRGDALFGLPFRSADGLGPLYIRASCESCHEEGGRGPGSVQKMAIVEADGVTPDADQSALPYGHTIRPFAAGGATHPIAAPQSGWPSEDQLKVTTRMPPPVLGRGYVEAVEEAEILRVEAAQAGRTDAIHGRINRVTYRSQPNPDTTFASYQPGQMGLVGRFGLKARQPSLDDFAADAFQGDMGLSSPLRPTEVPNPEGLADDAKAGVDLGADVINQVANYIRLIEIPKRDPAVATPAARSLFDELACSVCHVPSLRTRADYPVPQLAGIDAPIYSDLLLHDMGPSFADGLEDESARSSEWRTPPLIGLRFQASYLHDGRARSVDEAIVLHGAAGSQAADSVMRYRALSQTDRAALLAFVRSL